MLIWLRIRLGRGLWKEAKVLGTYRFPSGTAQVLQTADRRLHWTCDCEIFRRQGGHRQPVWCQHIDRAAARRSLDRLTRRVALAWGH
jgi:hypothetical protein